MDNHFKSSVSIDHENVLHIQDFYEIERASLIDNGGEFRRLQELSPYPGPLQSLLLRPVRCDRLRTW